MCSVHRVPSLPGPGGDPPRCCCVLETPSEIPEPYPGAHLLPGGQHCLLHGLALYMYSVVPVAAFPVAPGGFCAFLFAQRSP